MTLEKTEYEELLTKIEIISKNKQAKEDINLSKVIHVFNLDNYEVKEEIKEKTLSFYKSQYEKLIYMIKSYNITKKSNPEILNIMTSLHSFLISKTTNKKDNITIQIKELLFEKGLNFTAMNEVLEEVKKGVSDRAEIETNAILEQQVETIWEKFNDFQKNVDLPRTKAPMWILNMNYNELYENLLMTDEEKEKFEIKLKSILSHYAFSFASTVHDGKKTLLFDTKKKFKGCVEFIHSKSFISMLNDELKLGIKIREKNFSIKAAQISKQDSVKEIVDKMNEVYLKINNFEDYDHDELMDNIKKEFDFIKKQKVQKKSPDDKDLMTKILTLVKKLSSKYRMYIGEDNKPIEIKKTTPGKKN